MRKSIPSPPPAWSKSGGGVEGRKENKEKEKKKKKKGEKKEKKRKNEIKQGEK